MNSQLTEEEMRRALFGNSEISAPPLVPTAKESVPEIVMVPPAKPVAKKAAVQAFTPRLRVTLQVGNEFEGETYELIHEADTLSTLLAEQEATKAARRKYRYVKVLSIKSM
nr:hypothetical protein [uncultured Pseudomonas sp.]